MKTGLLSRQGSILKHSCQSWSIGNRLRNVGQDTAREFKEKYPLSKSANKLMKHLLFLNTYLKTKFYFVILNVIVLRCN